MINRKTHQSRKWLRYFTIFLVTIIISQISLPFINDVRIIPDYFIALIIALIALKQHNLNIVMIFFLGILVDIFIGELLGQYILAFLIIYMGNFTLHKFFKFQSYSQIVFLYLILLELGFLVLTSTSLTYQLNNNDINIFIYKNILTAPFCFLYKFILDKVNN